MTRTPEDRIAQSGPVAVRAAPMAGSREAPEREMAAREVPGLLADAARDESGGRHEAAVASYDAALDRAGPEVARETHLRRLTAIRAGGLGAADLREGAALLACDGTLAAEIEVRLELGRIAVLRGRAPAGVAFASEVQGRIPLLDDPLAAAQARGEAHRIAGVARVGLGQLAAAIAELDAAIASFVQLGDRIAHAEALTDRGLAHGYAGAYTAAVADQVAALALLRRLPANGAVVRAIAAACNNQGFALWNLGRDAEARTYLEEALALRHRLGDLHGEAVARNNLGNVFRHQGDLERARREYEQALALCRRSSSATYEAIAGNNLGQLDEEADDLASAERRYRLALQQATGLGDRIRMGDNLGNLGACLVRRGAPREAAAWLRQAVELRGAIGDRAYQIIDLSWLARAELAIGDKVAARAAIEQALAILGDGQEGTEQLQAVFLNAHRVYRELGEPAHAMSLLARAREIVETRAEARADPALQQAFRVRVRVNREIIETHERAVASGDLTRDTAAFTPPAGRPADTTLAPLVGRDQECEQLHAAVIGAARTRGGLWLISGEPGVGKTRLCEAVQDHARAHGFGVAWSRCDERDERASGAAWRQIVEAVLADSSQPVQLRARLGPAAGELAPAAAPATPAPPVTGFALVEATVAFLREASAARPLLVVIDDLHLADAASLFVLQHVAQQARHLPLLLLATYRDAEARTDDVVDRGIAALARGATRLPLRGLTQAELTALLPLWLGDTALPKNMVAVLHQRSGGNPLFARELAHDLALRLATIGSTESSTNLSIAPAVADAIAGRIRRVGPDARAILEVAAIVGRTFACPLVATVARCEEALVLRAIEAGVQAGLIEPVRGTTRFAFANSVVRTLLYRQLATEPRARLHLAVAIHVEPQWARGPVPRFSDLANHFRLGAASERAAHYHRLAGLQAGEQGLFESARRQLELALGSTPAEAATDERFGTLVALANAMAALGDVAGAAEHAHAAIRLVRGRGEPAALARVALGLSTRAAHSIGGPRAHRLHQEALAALGDRSPALRARLLSATCAACADRTEREQLGRAAIDLARSDGDPGLLASVLSDVIIHLAWVDNADERLAWTVELEALAARLDRPSAAYASSHARVGALVELGDLAAAAHQAGIGARIGRELRAATATWKIEVQAAMLAAAQGRLADAERLADSARALGQKAGVPAEAGAAWLLIRWRIRREQDRLGELTDELTARVAADENAIWTIALAQVRAASGDRAGAATLLAPILATDLEQHPTDLEGLAVLVTLAEASLDTGDDRVRRRLHDLLRRFASRTAMLGGTQVVIGPVALVVGQLAAALGRHHAALPALESALARARDGGSEVAAATAAVALASCLQQLGGYPGRIAPLLAYARDTYQRVGLPARADRIDQRLVEAPPVAAAVASLPFAVVREENLWRVTLGPRTVWVRDSLGMGYLDELVHRAGHDVHVHELANAAAAEELPVEGDAGELLDLRARSAYRARVKALEPMIAEAERTGAGERARTARAELDFIATELARAVGLGGRLRRAGSRSERLRQSVTKRVREAIQRIADQDPEVGGYLGQQVRTGVYCCFVASGGT